MNLAPLSESKPLTTRQRLSAHAAEPCANCHSLIDSIGFGFEKFDAIGKRREKEIVEFVSGYDNQRRSEPVKVELQIDSSGVVKGIANSQFSAPQGLGRLLASTPECQDCIAKQLFRYAMGRMESPGDRTTLERIQTTFRRSQFRFKELMIALVKSDAFLEVTP